MFPQKAFNISSLQAVVSTKFDLPLSFNCKLIPLSVQLTDQLAGVVDWIFLLALSVCPDVEDHTE